MKSIKWVGLAMLALLPLLSACGECDGCCESNQPYKFDIHGELQGVVVDAISGKQLDSAIVKLSIDGDLKRAQKLNNGDGTEAAGAYFFPYVPSDIEIPIFASADGYQNFEGMIKLDSHVLGTWYFLKEPTEVANIQLFPINYKTPPFQVNVTYANTPVNGATVLITPVAEDNSGFTAGKFLGAVSNRLATVQATTDMAGSAVFSTDSFVLGGAYKVAVLPILFSNKMLGQEESPTFIMGTDDAYWNISLTEISPTSTVTPQPECDDNVNLPYCQGTVIYVCVGGFWTSNDCADNSQICVEDEITTAASCEDDTSEE